MFTFDELIKDVKDPKEDMGNLKSVNDPTAHGKAFEVIMGPFA